MQRGGALELRGALQVVDSACVMCVRRTPAGAPPQRLSAADLFPTKKHQRGPMAATVRNIFGGRDPFDFESGWEVLMGQSEVGNFLRSSKDKLVVMRYAGEWKFAGGNVDGGEAVGAAARRELGEEFLRPLGVALPGDAAIRPFTVKQTRPVRGRSNLMYNFIALDTENPWLRELSVDSVNARLRERRAVFRAAVDDGRFWALDRRRREEVSPEVHELQWMPLADAVRHCLSSMLPGDPVWVNDFQRREWERWGLKRRRDPMFITAAALMELEGFPSEASLRRHSASVSLADLAREEQWLTSGMSADEADAAFARRVKGQKGRLNPSFKSAELVESLRRRRSAEDRAPPAPRL